MRDTTVDPELPGKRPAAVASVPVTTSGYVPPGVLVVLLNVSVVVAEPSELRETWAGENCQPTPVGMAPDAGAKLRFTDPLSAFTDCTVIG